jgi:hypothetical protein
MAKSKPVRLDEASLAAIDVWREPRQLSRSDALQLLVAIALGRERAKALDTARNGGPNGQDDDEGLEDDDDDNGQPFTIPPSEPEPPPIQAAQIDPETQGVSYEALSRCHGFWESEIDTLAQAPAWILTDPESAPQRFRALVDELPGWRLPRDSGGAMAYLRERLAGQDPHAAADIAHGRSPFTLPPR